MEQTLGKRIAQHRRNLKLTQDKLAESLGVTAQAVSKWENDQSCPDITMLPKLAQIFGTSVDELLGNEHQPAHEAEAAQPEEKKNDWNFYWDIGNFGKIGLAITILLLGIQLILAGYLQRELGFWSLLWPTALLIFGAWGIFPNFSFFRVGCLLFGGYFLLEKWELLPIALGGNIVFPVILVLLGLSLLADSTRKPRKRNFSVTTPGNQNYDYTFDIDSFDMDACFGSNTQLVAVSQLNEGDIDVCFGNYTIDLTQVRTVSEDCQLDADCTFSELSLLIPSRFHVVTSPTTAFGSVETIGEPDAKPEGIINLDAVVSFGKISIQYI